MEQLRISDEHIDDVVWPLGKSAYSTVAPRSRLADLNGKTIGELWNRVFRGEDIFPAVREALKERFPDIRFIDYTHFGNTHGPNQNGVLDELPALFEKYGCDAVVSGIGA